MNTVLLDQVCAHVRNYFEEDPVTGQRLIYPGTYTIRDNTFLPTPSFLKTGTLFRVVGSELNDAVYQWPVPAGPDGLQDETFNGVIWVMRPPRAFLALVGKIAAWEERYGETARSPFSSESVINIYAYTANSQEQRGWERAFRSELAPYRRL